LKKRWSLYEDQEGYKVNLCYLRDTSKREVDFIFLIEGKSWFAVECKKGGKTLNPSLKYFGDRLKIPYLYQIIYEGKDDVMDGRVRIMPAVKFLAALP
jgi:uncharacterized protein